MKKLFLVIFFLFALPFPSLRAETGSTTVALIDAIANLRIIVQNNETRISALEGENARLRSILQSKGIIVTTGTGVNEFTGGISTLVNTTTFTSNLDLISSRYSVKFAKMIQRMHDEWEPVRNNYQFPKNAIIGEYEFVEPDTGNAVFVDVFFSGGAHSGSYDAKLLYQYDEATAERKLLGLFIFDPQSRRYITIKGSNPFTANKRIKIRSPFLPGFTVPPVTEANSGTLTGTGGETPLSPPPLVTSPSTTVTLDDINLAYSEKRYLTTISQSDTYLASHPPTLELLKIRYRTFFILSKYKNSLEEIKKIEYIVSPLPRTIACDASVIANYSKDTELTKHYKAICNG